MLPQLLSAQQVTVHSYQPKVIFPFQAHNWGLLLTFSPTSQNQFILPATRKSLMSPRSSGQVNNFYSFTVQRLRVQTQRWRDVCRGQADHSASCVLLGISLQFICFPQMFQGVSWLFPWGLWFLFMTIACYVHFLSCKYFSQSQLESNEHDPCHLLNQDSTTSLHLHVYWLIWSHPDTSEIYPGVLQMGTNSPGIY